MSLKWMAHSRFVSFNTILASFQAIPINVYGNRESNSCFKIHPSGTFGRYGPAAPPLWVVPLHVPSLCYRKPAHHPGHHL